MNTLPDSYTLDDLTNQAIIPSRLLALIAPHAASQAMLTLAARLAQRGPLRVLDGGNRFNAYIVARALRRSSQDDPVQALERIRVARAFTCYQMKAMLEGTPPLAIPTLVIDLLDTFYDESEPLPERRRLAQSCAAHLRRLSQAAPVVVSLRPPPPPQSDPTGLLDILREAADMAWLQEAAPPASALRLL